MRTQIHSNQANPFAVSAFTFGELQQKVDIGGLTKCSLFARQTSSLTSLLISQQPRV
jgi:hypothetical protein